MKRILSVFIASLILYGCSVQNIDKVVETDDVQRILNTLASDDMKGRASFTTGIEKAATFIEEEFRKIGLSPVEGESSFRQTFMTYRIKPQSLQIVMDGTAVPADQAILISDRNAVQLDQSSAEFFEIKAGENFQTRYRAINSQGKIGITLVAPEHATTLKRLKDNLANGRVIAQQNDKAAMVYVIASKKPAKIQVTATNNVEQRPLFNVAGMIRGKTRPDEYVIFSAHYDHIGIRPTVAGDSIANGADDDASGTTAVIALAKYYQKLKNNERTLIFVAFTAEEIGGYGSRYFSSKMGPNKIAAMFNIEMIGKDSKFGPNTAFITGFERSDFGQILQKNLEGTGFAFHPDPYPTQNLFFRSDNATLARLGVPAHTISTVQIDQDKFYHTVDDEIETLDVKNIVSTIKGIALSARTIISGKDTPSRVVLEEN